MADKISEYNLEVMNGDVFITHKKRGNKDVSREFLSIMMENWDKLAEIREKILADGLEVETKED